MHGSALKLPQQKLPVVFVRKHSWVSNAESISSTGNAANLCSSLSVENHLNFAKKLDINGKSSHRLQKIYLVNALGY